MRRIAKPSTIALVGALVSALIILPQGSANAELDDIYTVAGSAVAFDNSIANATALCTAGDKFLSATYTANDGTIGFDDPVYVYRIEHIVTETSEGAVMRIFSPSEGYLQVRVTCLVG